ncbi:hypothetical protein Tco_1179354 [Tanacetum coccineum]
MRCACCVSVKSSNPGLQSFLVFFRSYPSRRIKLGELWDCQLGNLTAGKDSGGGGKGLSIGWFGLQANVYGEASTSQPKEIVHTNTQPGAKKVSSKSDDINIISFKNLFDALKDQDDVFKNDKSAWQKSNNIESTVNDSDSEEVKNVFWKVHYFDREDIEEVEHENGYIKKS